MTQLFYEISNNQYGGYTYHEFTSSWNGISAYSLHSAWLEFNTYAEAESYAKQRGGCDAFSY